MQYLKTRVRIEKPHIILVTETNVKHMKTKIEPAAFNIPGYQMVSKNLSVPHKRGIIIYTHNTLKNVFEEFSEFEFEEYLSIIMILKNKEKILISAIYRSESGSDLNNEELNSFIKEMEAKKCKHKIFVGDFNYKEINWSNTSTSKAETSKEFKFLETIKYCYLTQHCDKPTRGRGDQNANILDLVFTSDPSRLEEIEYQSPLGLSDHSVLLFDYIVDFQTNKNKKISYMYNKGDYAGMNETLSVDWDDKLQDLDVEAQWTALKSNILSAQDAHIPKFDPNKQDGWNAKGSVPLTSETRAEIRLKHRLWTRYYETGSTAKYETYKKQRNKVRRLLDKEQAAFEKNIGIESKRNPKKLWAYVKQKVKTRSGLAPLIGKNKKKSTNETEQAEILSEFFSEVMEREPEGEIPYLSPRILITEPLCDIKITAEIVEKKLKNLNTNKSSGPDQIHSRVLKETKTPLSKALAIIFRNSLDTGNVPKDWRSAIITPIYKKGRKSDPGNYRPVSLTSIICKKNEELIKDGIVEHMTINNLFSPKQYAFIKGRSTTLQMLKVLQSWVSTLDNGGTIDDINLDFMKAFDKVPHKRLIYKLQQYGISGKVIRWIENFLKNRVQRVNVNGYYSEEKEVLSGVPQGSVLGALLFVIYINDLPENIDSDLYLFADDTKFFRQINSSQDCWTVQKDLNLLELWSRKWLLKFHPDKCVVLRLKSNQETAKYTYRLNNHEVKSVSSVKDLGITVDEELKFREHMISKVNKANAVMGTIRRTFKYLDYGAFKMIYCAHVRVQVEYASPVWCPYLKKDIKLIENVQKKATKRLYGLRNLSYEERLKKLNLPTLAFRRLRGSMIEVYKIFHVYDEQATPNLMLSTNTTTRGHNFKLYCERSNREHPKLHAFNQRVVRPWNSLPDNIVNAKNTNSFKIFWINTGKTCH